MIFFRLIVDVFFLAFYVASGSFGLRLIIFLRFFVYNFFPLHIFTILYIFWLAQYCLVQIPLLCIRESDTVPTNKICCRASSEQRPRTRSCHESEGAV